MKPSHETIELLVRCKKSSTRGQRNGFDPLSGTAAGAHDADRKIDGRAAVRASEQVLHLFHRVNLILAYAINNQAPFDAGVVRRAIRLDRAHQDAAAGSVSERVR